MGQELLVNELIDAGERLAEDLNPLFRIDAAFWINPADSESWYLYLASDQISDGNIREAYGEIHRLFGENRYAWLDVFQVKLVNAGDEIVSKVIEIRDKSPGRIPVRYKLSPLAGMAIDGAYIYPSLETPSSTS